MQIELGKKEARLLMEMCCLGNMVINDYKLQEDRKKAYDVVLKRLLSFYLQDINNRQKPVTNDTDIYKMKDKLREDVMDYLDEYEIKSVPYALAQLLAEKNYPEEQSCVKNSMAKAEYNKALEKDGVSIITIDVPGIEERMNNFIQDLRKKGVDWDF